MRRSLRIALLSAGAIALVLLVLLERLSPSALPVPPQADVVIAGVTVINPGVERLTDHSIVVRDGRILEVRPRRQDDPAPLCLGCYAIPGLIDAHVHTPPRIALGNQELFSLLYLAHGVTTVRDVGASEGSVARLAARLNGGELVGPRMARCGPVLDGDPPGWPVATVVSGAESGTTAIVDQLADDGVDCIKVYNELQPEAFAAIAVAAERHALPLIGHVPHAVGLERVSDFEAQHMTGVPYLSRPRPPHGWDLRDEDVLLLSDQEIEAALRIARRQRVSFTPTLANFTLRLSASDPERFPPPTAARFLPEYWAGAWDLIAGHPSTHEAIERRLETQPSMRALVRRAHQHGIDIPGTDTIMPWVVPGESLHLELAALHEALGSAEAALAAATTVNGRHIAPGEIGTIAAGARADLLLTTQDPTEQLAALADWRVVFADGRAYDRLTVDAWLEDYRLHFRGGLYRAVVGTAVSFVVDQFEHTSKDEDESKAVAAHGGVGALASAP
jgi:imidazolonepropionase-like amidohydrolase